MRMKFLQLACWLVFKIGLLEGLPSEVAVRDLSMNKLTCLLMFVEY